MKSGKAVGPDNIPVEVWKYLGEAAVEFLTSLFNRVLESEKMPKEWRRSVLVPIFKNKGDVQSCSNYRGIKLMSHTMKLWERVVEARLRKVVEICEQQYDFMPRKRTTDAIFALRILMEKYRDGQRELHCLFVDLEKAYDRVPREELWYCIRKSGVAEKYVRVVQDMCEVCCTSDRGVQCGGGTASGIGSEPLPVCYSDGPIVRGAEMSEPFVIVQKLCKFWSLVRKKVTQLLTQAEQMHQHPPSGQPPHKTEVSPPVSETSSESTNSSTTATEMSQSSEESMRKVSRWRFWRESKTSPSVSVKTSE
ncbi:hypothetical protein QTP70_016954, partial [Hemibagrus guttatus]